MRDTIERLADPDGQGSDALVPRRILDQLPVGVIVNRAADGQVVYTNHEAERLIGGALSEPVCFEAYIGYGALDATGRPLKSEEYPLVRAVREGERVCGALLRMPGRDGTMVDLKIDASPVQAEDGRIVYGLAVVEDVTRLKQIEAQKAATETRLAEVLESTSDGIFVVDREFRIAFMNRRAMQTIADGRDLTGLVLWDEFPDAVGGPFHAAYTEALQTGQVRTVEADYARLKRTYEATAYPHADGLSVFFRDVTEARAARKARDAVTRELDHRVRNLFLLVAGMIRLGARDHDDVEAFSTELLGRIRALGEAHDLIKPAISGEALRSEACVRSLLEIVLKPHLGAANVRVEGDSPAVGPRSAADLALILHEFATNAAKYGALSATGGSLVVEVAVKDGECRLCWTEHRTGGIGEGAPSAGFGAVLVENIASAKLGGVLQTERASHGLVHRMRFPLDRMSL